MMYVRKLGNLEEKKLLQLTRQHLPCLLVSEEKALLLANMQGCLPRPHCQQ